MERHPLRLTRPAGGREHLRAITRTGALERAVGHEQLDRRARVDVALRELPVEPRMQRVRPLDPASRRAAARAVIPLAEPELVAGAPAPPGEPLHRGHACGVVVDAMHEEDWDVRLRGPLLPVA